MILNARLADGFTDDILEAIGNGMPMTFTYKVEMLENSTFWFDSLVSEITISNTVQYDPVTKTFQFSSTGKNAQPKIITRDIDLYKKLMLSVENVAVASLRELDPEETYYIRVKADLETDRFWFPFNYIFFFVPFNDVKTSWAESPPLAWKPERERAAGPAAPKTRKKRSGNPKVLDHVIRTFN